MTHSIAWALWMHKWTRKPNKEKQNTWIEFVRLITIVVLLLLYCYSYTLQVNIIFVSVKHFIHFFVHCSKKNKALIN